MTSRIGGIIPGTIDINDKVEGRSYWLLGWCELVARSFLGSWIVEESDWDTLI